MECGGPLEHYPVLIRHYKARLRTNIHSLLRELSGPCPLRWEAEMIVSKLLIWNPLSTAPTPEYAVWWESRGAFSSIRLDPPPPQKRESLPFDVL